MKPKILHKYIFYELVSPFALGLLVFTFILLMNKILRLVDLLVNKGVSLVEVCTLIGYLMPSFLVLTLPMAILLAILIALGKFSSDAELMAMKASGVSLYQLLPPFVILCVAGFFFTNVLTLYLLPKGNYAFRTALIDLAKKHSDSTLEEGVFIDSFDGIVLYINSFDQEENKVKGIFILDRRDPNIQTIVVAQHAVIFSGQDSTNMLFKLTDGSLHRLDQKTLSYQYALFNNNDMNVQLSDVDDDQDFQIKYKEMEIDSLWNLANERQDKNLSATNINVEINKRFALPFACLVFGVLGVSLGSYWRRGGRSYGFIFSLVIVFFYYLFLTIGENFAKSGLIFAFMGIWLPNIVLGSVGLYLFFRAAREKPLPVQWFDRHVAPAIETLSLWIKPRRGL